MHQFTDDQAKYFIELHGKPLLKWQMNHQDFLMGEQVVLGNTILWVGKTSDRKTNDSQ